MDVEEYLGTMGFHTRWREHGVLPAELIERLCPTYQPGMAEASEHDRNGVFHWWLRNSPTKEVLMRLVELSFLDPDQIMAEDVRDHIARSASYDRDVERRIVDGRLSRLERSRQPVLEGDMDMLRRFVLVASCLALSACSSEGADAVDLSHEKIECNSPAEAEYGAWSKSGSYQACKIKHGPFVAWEDGYVHVRGEYDMGKEAGVWRWYDRKGDVVREIDYSAAATSVRKE